MRIVAVSQTVRSGRIVISGANIRVLRLLQIQSFAIARGWKDKIVRYGTRISVE
jgi:uncharacterized protein (DUF433 family)